MSHRPPPLPFGFDPKTAARCIRCGKPTRRRITRDEGICAACEDRDDFPTPSPREVAP